MITNEDGEIIMEMQLCFSYIDTTTKRPGQTTATDAIAIYQVQKPNTSGSGAGSGAGSSSSSASE